MIYDFQAVHENFVLKEQKVEVNIYCDIMNCIDITIMLKIIKLFKLVLKFRIFNEYLEIEKNDGINI